MKGNSEMKKLSVVFLAVVIAMALAGCGGEKLPESCMLYYDYAGISVVADDSSDAELAEKAYDGVPETMGVHISGKADVDLITGQFQEGTTIEELTDGKASSENKVGAVVWNGEAYNAFKITADNCNIPNVFTGEGGILLLDIKGDCTAGGGGDIPCFGGFDTVVITGDGTLDFKDCSGLEAGAGNLPLPSVIVSGADVRCADGISVKNNSEDVPAVLVLDGQLNSGSVYAIDDSADVCVAGGSFTTEYIDGAGNLVFRDGVSVIDMIMEREQAPAITVSGGQAYFNETLPKATAVEAGAGSITAPGLSGMDTVNTYNQAEATDSEKSGTGYIYTDFNSEWTKGITCDKLCMADVDNEYFFKGCMKLNSSKADKIEPWGGLWLNAKGKSSTNLLCGTGLLITGNGSIDADELSLFGWGNVHKPVFAVRDDAAVSCGSFTMDSEAGEEGRFIIDENAAFSCRGNLWMKNAAVMIRGGNAEFAADFAVEAGRVEISGGTVVLNTLYLADGDLEISGGKVIVAQNIDVPKGNVTVTGGEVIIPGGEDGFNVSEGKLTVKGGSIHE